jgi:hypothetical protein
MGYYTRFELSWQSTPEWKPPTCGHENHSNAKFCSECGFNLKTAGLDIIVGDAIDALDCNAIKRDGSSYDSVKWYDHVENMREMSKAIPNVLFHLSGEGEDSGDIWDLYALNGKTQKHQAELVRKQPDPKAWK